MFYIIHSEPSGFAAFILTSAIMFMIIRGIIRTIIKVIKYFISIIKKKKQAEESRQMKEKWRLLEEKWARYDENVAELKKAIENASSHEEEEALY